jgi:amino acid adenylation domain-containing protein
MEYPCVLSKFINHAETNPDSIAIQENNLKLTYELTDSLSNSLAYKLNGEDSNNNTLCFVICENRIPIILSLLGVMKAGKTFVPINPEYSDNYIGELLNTYKPAHVILDEACSNRFKNIGELGHWSIKKIIFRPCKDIAWSKPTKFSFNHDPQENLDCYIYFTSGTTGKPKGILGTRNSLNHFIAWQSNYIGDIINPKVTQLSAPSFDAFLRDVFLPLSLGGTIHIPPIKEGIIQLDELIEWINKRNINIVHCVPTIFRSILSLNTSLEQLGSLNYIFLSGEALFGKDVQNWRAKFGSSVTLVNLYGPSETTMTKFQYKIDYRKDIDGAISIGKPIEGCKAILLDRDLTPVDGGSIGEIFIYTKYHSKGYFKKPEETRKVFINHPGFKGEDKVIYKTGDLAIKDEKGNYFLKGRVDNQIKVKGIRVEIESLEMKAIKLAEINQVVFVYHHGVLGMFYTSERGENDRFSLMKKLEEEIPSQFLPLHLIFLEKLPRNYNGKVDRNLLNNKFEKLLENKEVISPKTQYEKKLAQLWADITGTKLKNIGSNHNFFEIGGHSLNAMIVINRISVEFQVQITLNEIFTNSILEDLAKKIKEKEKLHGTNQENYYEGLKRVDSEKRYYSLSHNQMKEVIGFQIRDENSFNLNFTILLEELDVARMKRSIDFLINRHEALRTKFVFKNNSYFQEITTSTKVNFELNYFDFTQNENRKNEVLKLYKNYEKYQFNLFKDFLFRVVAVKYEQESFGLLFVINHSIADEISINILKDELQNIYNQFDEKELLYPLEPEIQNKDYADFANRMIEEKNSLDYYRQKIVKNLEAQENHTFIDKISYKKSLQNQFSNWRPEKTNYFSNALGKIVYLKPPPGATYSFFIQQDLYEKMKNRASDNHTSLFSFIISTIVTWYSITHHNDVFRVYIPFSTRVSEKLQNTIGWLTSEIILALKIDHKKSFESLIKDVVLEVVESSDHRFFPHELLLEKLDVTLNNLTPLMINMINSNEEIEDFSSEHSLNGTGHFPIRFTILEYNNGLSFSVQYNKSLYKSEEIERMLNLYQQMLRQLALDSNIELQTLEICL